MQAIILAAGYGRRMRPLSRKGHKALLPIAGTTILGHIMDALADVDVHDVTVVTGYRADDVERFLRAGYPNCDLRFVQNDRFAETNNIVSLALALDRISFDADVLLLECDVLFQSSLLARLVEHPATNAALVDRYRTGMDGTVVSVSEGLVAQVFPREHQGADFDYGDKFKTLNVYRFDRDFCRRTLRPLVAWYADQIDSQSYYELVLGMLANLPEHRIAAVPVDSHRWAEVDDPNDLAIARFEFEPSRRTDVLDRNLGGHWNFDFLDFSFMRNAYFPNDAMFAAMRHALPSLAVNYGSSQVVLNEKLAFFLECDPAKVQVLNGAAQAFPILQEMIKGPVAVPNPTFGEYARAFPDAVSYEDRPGIDWAEVERLADTVEALVVVNPNTPSGVTLETSAIYDLAQRHNETIILVDESFCAFSDQPSIIELLEETPLDNVIVLTSMSKSLGTPGLRLGHLYSSNQAIIGAVGKRLPIWNLSAPAEYLLELLLKFRVEFATSLERTKADRDVFRRQLNELSFIDEVYSSGGNFLLVRLVGESGNAEILRRRLLSEFRIELKNVTERFPDGLPWVRVAVRLPDENAQLIHALESLGTSAFS